MKGILTLVLVLSCGHFTIAQDFDAPKITPDPIPEAPALTAAKGLQPLQKSQAAQQKPQVQSAQQKPLAAQTQKGKGSSRVLSVEGTGRGGRLTLRDRLRLLKKIRRARQEDRRFARSSSPPQRLEAVIR